MEFEDLDENLLTLTAINVEKNYSLSQTMRMYDVNNSDNDLFGTFDILSHFTQENLSFTATVDENCESHTDEFRFSHPLTDSDLLAVKTSGENSNTRRSTDWSMGIWQAWRQERNMRTVGSDFVVDLLEMDDKALDLYLSFFVVEIKKN